MQNFRPTNSAISRCTCRLRLNLRWIRLAMIDRLRGSDSVVSEMIAAFRRVFLSIHADRISITRSN